MQIPKNEMSKWNDWVDLLIKVVDLTKIHKETEH